MKVNVSVKRRIVVNGKEYGSVEELPQGLRAAYEKAIADGRVPGTQTTTSEALTRIVVNGQSYDSLDAMPPDVRRLYDDALATLGSRESASVASGGSLSRVSGVGADDAEMARLASSPAPIGPTASSSPPTRVLVLALGLLLLGLLAYLLVR